MANTVPFRDVTCWLCKSTFRSNAAEPGFCIRCTNDPAWRESHAGKTQEPPEEIDQVSVRLDTTTVDVVEAIYGSRHHRYCNYVPEINPITKLIYCRTCTSQIGSLWSEADYDEMRRMREE